MKNCVRVISFVVGMLLSLSGVSQQEIKVNRYQPTLEYGEKVFVQMGFGKSDLENRPELSQIDVS